ncbi:MAG: hypothetical protein ACOCZK_05120 [Planctomycetota bacterium]
MADRPEDSAYTGNQERCLARQEHRKAAVLLEQAAQGGSVALHLRRLADQRHQQGPEAGLWIAPIPACTLDERRACLELDDYLELVDQTGRIPPELRSILERLQLDADAWLQEMRSSGFLFGAAIGSMTARGRSRTPRSPLGGGHRRRPPSTA